MDKQEMNRALHAFFAPGDVFEVRILDASTHEYRKPHIESGYFEYEKIELVAPALAHIQSYRGIYVTANPVDPDLLSRAVNRIKPVGRTATTSDTDIVKRRWLLVDCDAIRKSDIASSEDEHNAALQMATEIKEGLVSISWAEPIMVDSGNGAQLMFRVDLAADDGGLIQRVVQELNKVSTKQVDIDLTVYNASRIWRLPGTMNCKGDHTERRPHRMAKILSMPETLEVVTEKQLIDLVPSVAVPVEPAEQVYFESNSFNLDTWVAEHCPELIGKEAKWSEGRKWVFDVCPFDPAHADRAAVLIQMASGAMSFKCHHNGCIGNDWKALRLLLDPDHELRKRPVIDPDVNLTGILVQANEEQKDIQKLKKQEEEDAPWRKITTNDVKKAIEGTMLGELTEIYSGVTNPPLPIEAALLKAIVTLGCCLSGEATQEELNRRVGGGNLEFVKLSGIHRAKLKINTGGGQGNNIYAILAGNSASGKDIGNLLDAFAGFSNPSARGEHGGNYLVGTGGSAEGIADALIAKPNGLVMISELRDWLDEKHWQHNATGFLTEAFNKASFSIALSSRGGKHGSRGTDFCLPSILANVQPQTFDRLVSVANVETGFLGRFLFAKMPKFLGDPACFDALSLISKMEKITSIFTKKQGIINVPQDYTKELKEIFQKNSNERLDASWRRLSNEYYPRLAVQLSVTLSAKTHGETVLLTDECWAKARVLTMWFFANAEKMLSGISEESQFIKEREEQFKKLFVLVCRLYQKLKKPVTMRCISQNGILFNGVKSTAKERREALGELVERGILKIIDGGYVPLDAPEGWR